jgi:enoyl-CoA hydratase/carnithine racemase
VAALDQAAANSDILVVLLTGAGSYFTSGADVKAANPVELGDIDVTEWPVTKFMLAVLRFPKFLVAVCLWPSL